MYLFVRALTGDWRAAFVAGLLFAFTPYRLASGAAPAGDVVAMDAVRALGIRKYFDATSGTGSSPTRG